MLPKWDNSYSVHNKKIDEQHKSFKLAAKVEVVSDRSVGKMNKELWLTLNYMKDHFNDVKKIRS